MEKRKRENHTFELGLELSQQAATWQTRSLMGQGMELQRSEDTQSIRRAFQTQAHKGAIYYPFSLAWSQVNPLPKIWSEPGD